MLTAKNRYGIEILIHMACWTGVYYTLSSLTNSQIRLQMVRDGIAQVQQFERSLFPYTFLTLGFLMLLFYGNIFWLLKKVIRYSNVIHRVLAVAGWFLLMFTANFLIIRAFLNGHQSDISEILQHPPAHGTNIDVGGWAHTQQIMLLIFLAISGISIAYFFLREWAKSELLHNRLQTQQLDTEIKFLKSQINPHFLFNTLNNLFSMAQQKGNDELADGISKLSGMMRYMIYDSNGERVSLQQEIDYLQNCITLNKLRYADEEARVVFTYPARIDGIFVAPMLFIPFVENAFKHGVAIGHTSEINISFTINEGLLTFNCMNSIYNTGKKLEIENNGIGLENIKRRLKIIYPGTHVLEIDDRNGKYNATLQINLG